MAVHNVLGRINGMMEELPKAERKIAEYVFEYPEAIINMTAAELGEEADSSAATVIRFCKRVGVSSFTKLKVMVSGEINSESPAGYSDIKANESIDEIMNKLLGNAHQSMKDTIATLEKETLLQTVIAMEKVSEILVFGVGASRLVAENIEQKWSRIGKTCISYSDPHNLVTVLASKRKNAMFIGISNSGETIEVAKLMEIANENGCPTVSLTRFGKNTISSKSDISLHTVRANEEELRSAATSSLHAQFIAVDVLFYTYASRNYNTVIKNIKRSRLEINTYNEK